MTAVGNAPYFIAIHLFLLLFFSWRFLKGERDKLVISIGVINFAALLFNILVLLVEAP